MTDMKVSKIKLLTVFMGLIIGAVVLALLPYSFSAPLLVFIAAIIFAWILRYGLLYAMVFLIPFIGFTASLSDIPLLRTIPFIGSWDAPICDFIALLLVLVVGSYMIHYERVKKIHHHIKEHLPAIKWYGSFLLISALTIFKAPEEMQADSLHYFIRFVLFSYIGYVALLYWMVKSKEHVKNIIFACAWSGILTSIFGAISLFVSEPFWGVWRRVSPFSINGFAPLGLNHNLLSEVLIFTIPLVFYIAFISKESIKRWYVLAGVFMIIIALLTFGRTAWIVLSIQGIVFLMLERPKEIKQAVVRAWPVIVIGLFLFIYMLAFSSSEYVKLSNNSRMDLTRFAVLQAAKTPVFGFGIGTFMPALSNSRAFMFDYGDPIEAHGFVQKLLFETGVVGLSAFVLFFAWLIISIEREWNQTKSGNYKSLLLAVLLMVLGVFVFQIFNTSYFNAKMWFPVGFALVVLIGKWKFLKT